MSKSILGIEFGAGRLKAAQMKNGVLERFMLFDMPEDTVHGDTLVAFDALSQFLNENVRKQFKVRNVALVVPSSKCYVRRLSLPAMTVDQLKVNLPYEFRDVITEDKYNYIYDYSVFGIKTNEDGKPKEMDLMAAAVSRETIENYTEMFARAHMKLVKAAPQELAMGALVRKVSNTAKEGDFAALDLGWSGTRVNIYRNGIYEVTRSIDTGLSDVANAIADTLGCDPHIAAVYLNDNKDNILNSDECKAIYASIGVEVTRAINYYTYENRDNTLEHLYYCGHGAGVAPMIAELSSSIPLTLIPFSELSDQYSEGNAITDGPCAVGICLE
ncbi:MAG: hypothetical protein EOM64_00290 [Erysipelotrichia bacterium]|nr:hypothetical protein [Erysipelotrichia bacterium]